MKNKSYKIEPRLTRKWFGIFGEPLVAYDIVMSWEYWHDPTYGNGGGDYVTASKTLCTMKTFCEANAIVNKLISCKREERVRYDRIA